MFDIDGDIILFEGREVARFTGAAWPSLRERIDCELIAHVVDAVSPEDHEAAIADVRAEYEDYVERRGYERLQQQFDALQDKYDQLVIDWDVVRSELVKENNDLCWQRDKLATQVMIMKRKLKDATRA